MVTLFDQPGLREIRHAISIPEPMGGWNEGDEMIWIDGESGSRIHGTGGEDYFNGAWGFSAIYSYLFTGLTEFHGWEPGARISHYRWHLEALIRFRKSIRVTLEDGHANLGSDTLFSVAYWYQLESHKPLPALPPASARIPKVISVGGPGQDAEMQWTVPSRETEAGSIRTEP